jgi:hypothetical protein
MVGVGGLPGEKYKFEIIGFEAPTSDSTFLSKYEISKT